MSTRSYKHALCNISERTQISRFRFVETFSSGLEALYAVAYPGILFGRGGGSTISVEDGGQTEWGSGGGSPLVRSSGGGCNLLQEISFHTVKFS